MNEGFEAAGDAITGGVIARTVEPAHGEAAPLERGQHSACLNCGTALSGSYCASCGQAAHVHRSITGLWHDIAHGVFHFEGKVWRTLPMLVWRPGDLSRRYIHGERARFVSPLALFLFCVFLMFATFESVGGPIRAGVTVNSDGAKSAITEMARARDQLKADLVLLEARRAGPALPSANREALDRQIADKRSDADGLAAAVKGMTQGIDTDDLGKGISVNTGDKAFDAKIKDVFKNPKLLLYKLQSSAYKFAWALIPLSIPFMWLIFAWRRQYKLYDHAVFVTYSLSFVMILLVAMALLATTGASTAWALFLVPVHMFRQLQQAYGLSRLSALWRTAALLFGSSLVLILFAAALLVLGLLG